MARAQVLGNPLTSLSQGERHLFYQGKAQFERLWSEEEGLGPQFNQRSCAGCHRIPTVGGFGASYNAHLRLGEIGDDGVFRTLPGHRFGVLRERANRGTPILPIPPEANAFSIRQAAPLFGLGLIEAIPEEQIRALIDRFDLDGDGVSGRAPSDGRKIVRRFGSQSQAASLLDFVSDAFVNELGLVQRELPSQTEDLIAAFLRLLAPPARGAIDDDVRAGGQVFARIGCADCHTPSFDLPDAPYATTEGLLVDSRPLRGRRIHPYSDFLLHDMGPELDDGVALRQSRSSEYRTTPLWGLRMRSRYLHDGRARDFGRVLLLHGGEASAARLRSRELAAMERSQLLRFLDSL